MTLTLYKIQRLNDSELSLLKSLVNHETDRREAKRHSGPCSRNPLKHAQGICSWCDEKENRALAGGL